MTRRVLASVLSVAVASSLLVAAAEIEAQEGRAGRRIPDVTPDGLHRVDPGLMASAWVKPGMNLSRYSRIFVRPTAVQFRDVPDRKYTIKTLSLAEAFHVDGTRQEQLRGLFEESFQEAMLGVRSYERSEQLGRNVLMIQGMLTDVISGVPPDLPGSVVQNIRWAWEANIILELRDSMTDEVLARTVTRERIDGPFYTGMVWALTPGIVKTWSLTLVRHLNELSDLSGRPDVPGVLSGP